MNMAFSMCKVRHKQLPQKVLHRENEAKFKAKPQQHEYMWKCMAWPECGVGYTFIYLQSSQDCTHNIQTIVWWNRLFLRSWDIRDIHGRTFGGLLLEYLVTLRKNSKIKSLVCVVKYYLFMAFFVFVHDAVEEEAAAIICKHCCVSVICETMNCWFFFIRRYLRRQNRYEEDSSSSAWNVLFHSFQVVGFPSIDHAQWDFQGLGSNELLLLHLKKATTNIIHLCCVIFLVKMFKDPSTATRALIGTAAMSIFV